MEHNVGESCQLHDPYRISDNLKAVAEALQILGYPRVYHMREVAKHRHQDKWARLLDMKYSKLEDIPISEVDDILKDFDVSSVPLWGFLLSLIADQRL